MNSVVPEPLVALRQLLPEAGPFGSNRELRDALVDARVAQWRNHLPEADSVAGRVDATLHFMLQQQNDAGENGLVLLLYTLADRLDPADASRDQVRAIATQLQAQLSQPLPPEASLAGEPNPYRGLAPFTERDQETFFGRRHETERLWQRLQSEPFVAVVGASGSGKSSLVQAGLLPLTAAAGWQSLTLTPGPRPGRALADQLATLFPGDPLVRADELEQRLQTRHDGLSSALATALTGRAGSNPILLFIDQFEELFTQHVPNDAQQQFVANLVDLVQAGPGRVRLLITLRADFVHRCLQFPSLPGLLEAHALLLGPLSQDDLREAITGPAGLRGARLAEGLVSRILADMTRQPDALPLLQVALAELWTRRRGIWLTHAAYDETGRVSGAIEQRAESLYHDLPAPQQWLARNLFLRLVAEVDGEPGRYTRRRIPQTAFTLVGSSPADRAELLGQLSGQAARLISLDADSISLTHEALIDQWARLQAWLSEEQAQLPLRQRLAQAAQLWNEQQQHPGYLYQDPQLQQVQDALPTTELSQLEAAFVQASVAAHQAEQTRQRRNQLMRLALLALVLVIVALAAGSALYRIRLRQQALQLAGNLVHLNGGTITMGNEDGLLSNERPVWTTTVAPFGLEPYEVSNRQYRLCEKAGACADRPGNLAAYLDDNFLDHPVVHVNAFQAQAYCQWLGRRLPLEVEWEYAARGLTARPWPWGAAALDPSRANLAFGTAVAELAKVDSYPAGKTPEGAFNLLGNVMEWTATSYQEYPYSDPYAPSVAWDGQPGSAPIQLTVRGGSFALAPSAVSSTARTAAQPDFQSRNDLGFRCAQDAH